MQIIFHLFNNFNNGWKKICKIFSSLEKIPLKRHKIGNSIMTTEETINEIFVKFDSERNKIPNLLKFQISRHIKLYR